MQKTTFNISKMDCSSEEQLIRLKLGELENIDSMAFDIPRRTLEIYHSGKYEPILETLETLQLGAAFVETETIEALPVSSSPDGERKLLWQVLAINFFFFVLELLTGLFFDSMGLFADGLDMLADSLVYALALFAVGGAISRKKSIARASGYFQLVLAVLGLIEVVRRFLGYGETPVFEAMIIVSILALTGNAACLYLLQKSKSTEAHMQASMIFTSNDVIINIGVIAAGLLVFLTASKIPDLLVGAIVFVIVGRGAYRILQIAK